MARFVLQPCRFREGWLVPVKDESPLVVDWRELSARFAPSKEPRALSVLRLLQTGAYLGLVKGPRGPSNFVVVNPDRSGNITKIVKRDPSFAGRLISAYRVDEVQWADGAMVELGGSRDG
jgi:hypothetical protein